MGLHECLFSRQHMRRRTLLKRCSASLVAGTSATLAGCNSDGGNGGTATAGDQTEESDGGTATAAAGDGTDAGATGGGSTATATPGSDTGSSEDSAVRSDLPELEVVDYGTSTSAEDFVFDLTIRNVGDERTGLVDYNYGATLYDGDGNDITGRRARSSSTSGHIEPGSTGEVTHQQGVAGDPGEVADYELVVDCAGMLADGAYCE